MPVNAKRAPAATTIVLVRHGTTPSTGKVLPGRARGLHLADKGKEEARTVAATLARWNKPKISAVYSSPLERTRETAAPIARALGLPVRPLRGLLECDYGDWTGAELKKLAKLPEWATVQRYPSGFTFPGGESFKGMQARVVGSLVDLCARHPGEAVVAVSHADVIKAAVADALGCHLDLFQRIVVSPCSVTAVVYGPLGPTVLGVNWTQTPEEDK